MAFQRSDGDIAATLDAMFHSPEFKASLGVKFKDPAHYAISSVRLAYDDRAILNIQNWLNRLAEGRTWRWFSAKKLVMAGLVPATHDRDPSRGRA